MDNPIISARNLVFSTPEGRWIDGLTLDIAPGRRTMILGANGAGKSLALRLFHGLLQPTSGEILWDGQAENPDALMQQSMVFQHPTLLRRSVRRNLDFALGARGVARAERMRRVEALLEEAGMTHLASRPARVLSGGEVQRLALARALIVRPRVVFLDEPTASLDPAATAEIERLILKAHADGIAVIMVTHNAGQARRLGEDVVFLHGGRVVETGPAEKLLRSPDSDAARTWLDGGLLL